MNKQQEQNSTTTLTHNEVRQPELYKVILLNDDFTSQDFVVAILITIFGKTLDDAKKLMLEAHKNGQVAVGTYNYDIATSKSSQVSSIATENGFPLACKLERE
ncbi:MAG: ATP-dependent Clp protease adaptor ClpS [Treponema sp.]|nr:MAG: ATP-dependent Clp protease adaptor ClpS [Treponema sp.]